MKLLFQTIAILLLASCSKPILTITTTYSDPLGYKVSFSDPSSQSAFEKKLISWCDSQGYHTPSNPEISKFLSSSSPGNFDISKIIYLDSSRPKSGVLITYMKIENDVIFISHAIRDGTRADHSRQIPLIDNQRKLMQKAFPELTPEK
jgi:hypothetical protein